MKVFKNYWSINYDAFIPKMSSVFNVLKNTKDMNYVTTFSIDGCYHQFNFNIEEDGKYKSLYIAHTIEVNWTKAPPRGDFMTPDFFFTFEFHHRKRLFDWNQYMDNNCINFPIRNHVLFRCNNLVYPELFLKKVDLMLVELI